MFTSTDCPGCDSPHHTYARCPYVPRRTDLRQTRTAHVMTPELRSIVITIDADFGPKPAAYAARPYLDALLEVEDDAASFEQDDVHGMILRLRGNIRAWRGPLARETKARLDALLAPATA